MSRSGFRAFAAGLLLSLGVVSMATAQTAASPVGNAPVVPAAPAAPAPGAVAVAKPSPDDTQAQRQRVQPLNNAPVWRDVNSSDVHTTTLPRHEGGRLIQREGQAWRLLRNGPVTTYGGWALVAAVLGVSAFFALRGTIRLSQTPTGRTIERFTALERTVHWTMAISFVLLAVTGLALLFGKHVLLPVIGSTAFSWIAQAAKIVHNYIGPLFSVALVLGFITFVRDNFPNAGDLKWLAKGGGLFSGEHVPSHRFNAGEKVWFWLGVFLLGILVSGSGLILDFPNFDQTRAQMQTAWTVHAVAALIFMLLSIGHIYMGTLGMEGAYRAMRTGQVDEAWAREHHEWWYDDVVAGKIPAQRSKPASPGGSAAASGVRA